MFWRTFGSLPTCAYSLHLVAYLTLIDPPTIAAGLHADGQRDADRGGGSLAVQHFSILRKLLLRLYSALFEKVILLGGGSTMGTEHRVDDRVRRDAFDWWTPATERGIPLEKARAFYDESLRRALDPSSRSAKDLYFEWLASWRPDEPLPVPGRRTLTMPIGPGGPSRLALTPGKRTLLDYLDHLQALPVDIRKAGRLDHVEARPGRTTLVAAYDLVERNASELDDEQLAHEPARVIALRAARTSPSLPDESEERGSRPALAARLEVTQDARSDWLQALQRGRVNAAGDAKLPAGEGEPLRPALRSRLEAVFQHDFAHVRIHTDGPSGDAARQMKAHAVTRGAHVFFGHGKFAPGTPEGDRLLVHELTHVVQADQGRMPSHGGLSSPHDEHEREAYAAETGLAGALSQVDAGELAPPTSALVRSTDRASAHTQLVSRDGDDSAPSTPTRTGPTTSEAALLGELPTIARAPRSPATRPAEGSKPPPGLRVPLQVAAAPVTAKEAAKVAASAPSAAPVRAATMREAPAGSTSAGSGAGGSGPVAASPALASAAAWAVRARDDAARQVARIREAASTAASRVRVASRTQQARATIAFAEARARLEADAETARTQIHARSAVARAALESRFTELSTQLDADLDAREETARGAVETARAHITDGAGVEAQRAITESEARAERARALADIEGSGGEAPLAAGQRDIARRVANEVAAQCIQTGADAAVEVRKAETSQRSGIDGHLDGVLATLAQARESAKAKLDSTRDASLSSLDDKATEASTEIDARVAEASATLATHQSELTGWLANQDETEAAALEAKAEELTGPIDQRFTALASAYDQCQAELDAARAEAPEDLDGYAVKELMDALGGPALKKLADDLGGAAVKQLLDELGEATLKKLANELGGTAIKELSDGLTPAVLNKLANELGGTAVKELSDGLTPAVLNKLANELGGTAIKELSDGLTPAVLNKLADDLGGTAIKALSDGLTPAVLKKLANELDGTAIKKLADDIGAAEVRRLVTELGDDVFIGLVKELDAAVVQRLAKELGAADVKKLFQQMTTSSLHKMTLAKTISAMGIDEFLVVVKREGADAVAKYGGQALAKHPKAVLDFGAAMSAFAKSPPLDKLQKKWKHAADFGVAGNWSLKNTAAHKQFIDAMNEVIANANHVLIGPYSQPQTVFFFFKGDKVVLTDLAGEFCQRLGQRR